jgi:hypothetical protein
MTMKVTFYGMSGVGLVQANPLADACHPVLILKSLCSSFLITKRMINAVGKFYNCDLLGVD